MSFRTFFELRINVRFTLQPQFFKTRKSLLVDPSMLQGAAQAAEFLKSLANENRLLILCHLSEGEMSVSELEDALGLRQPTLSQQLARLRTDKLVETRRVGKTIYYSLASDEVGQLLELMYGLFCSPEAKAAQTEMVERRKAAVG